jgi:hypothetical protein
MTLPNDPLGSVTTLGAAIDAIIKKTVDRDDQGVTRERRPTRQAAYCG